MKLNKYNRAEKYNTAEKYNCEWRRNTWRQHARREAGAVIGSSNCHLICMLGQKTIHTGLEMVQVKPLKRRGSLWKVRQTGRLELQHFSLFTDFILLYFKWWTLVWFFQTVYRPGVAVAVLKTPLLLIDCLSQTVRAGESVFIPPDMSNVTCHVSHFMCHISHVTCHVSAKDPPPANSPIIHSRLALKPKKVKNKYLKGKNCVIDGQYLQNTGKWVTDMHTDIPTLSPIRPSINCMCS